jgi:predicted 2-oxoglutarate/Fe(II)-dependent dioxygenase YbiX
LLQSRIGEMSRAATMSPIRPAQNLDDPARRAPILVPDVLSPDECQALIADMLKYPPHPTPVLRAGVDGYEPTVRNSESCVLGDLTRTHVLNRVENAARLHWPRDSADSSVISAPHFFRYPEGGFVAPHRDRSPNNDDPREVRWRMASLVLFLNSGLPPDGFEGGKLIVYVPRTSGPTIGHAIRAQAGTLALFEPGLMHEVTRVTRGARYTLVAWLVANQSSMKESS